MQSNKAELEARFPESGFPAIQELNLLLLPPAKGWALSPTFPSQAAFPGATATQQEAVFVETDAGPTTGQWHLESSSGYDINVLDAWQDYTGAGVTVGVVDSGFQYSHHELSANYNSSIDYDFLQDNGDGANKTAADRHGTAVAGVIGAANNGIGTTGVAYGSTLTSFRLISSGSSIYASQVANALTQNVDVSNNSWGWTKAFVDDGSFGATIENALQSAVTNNRGGLGTVLVFSAGNDGDVGDNANYSEMLNSRFVIGVGAANQDGTRAYFSNPGASLLISAPGTFIYTTDITGSGGYSSGDYYTIQGTSFSAPIISGVVALMLDANPNLGYRDVQEILAYSARKTDPGNSNWQFNGADNWNGGGLHTNDNFGFGFVDATAAVRLAESWLTVSSTANVFANEASYSFTSAALNHTFDNTFYDSWISVGTGLQIEHVEVQLSLSHNWMPDLSISLMSPDGTTSLLMDRPSSSILDTTSYVSSWTFSSTQFWGETGLGDWRLRVTDGAAGNSGTLQNWTLKLYGADLSSDDTYVYTNEYAGFTGAGDASRRLLQDSGGNDTINAAAVSSALNINLTAGSTNTIAGNTLTIDAGTTIENVIGGDGNDTLTGNNQANILYGGRGGDNINGGSGNDILYGNDGNDVLNGGSGVDTLYGGMGDDIYYVDSLSDVIVELADQGYDIVYSTLADYVLSQYVELLVLLGDENLNVTGSEADDTLYGNTGANVIDGVGGNDRLYGYEGNDTLYGGDGDDGLDGGAGADRMVGGAGNDAYHVENASDVVVESAGEGTDTVYAYISHTLAANVEVLRLQGSENLSGTGNDEVNWLYGNTGNNTLSGAGGGDYLDGGAGADLLIGGDGDDIFVIDNAGDTTTELANEGTDTVRAYVDYTLGNYVENLQLMGSANLNGTGNALHNSLNGNSGNNILSGDAGSDYLDGKGGDDTLIGGTGHDIYVVDSTNDVITENAGEGTETVIAYASYTLSANLEILKLQGSANLTGMGNGDSNWLYGNSGANLLTGLGGADYLDGGAGADTLIGGTGDDVYMVDNAGDLITENAGEGTDSVRAQITYTLGNHLENLFLQGSGNISGTGNALNNSIIGNSGNNTLSGAGGDDFINGGLGADSMLGGAGNDVFTVDNVGDTVTENAGEGSDTVLAYVNFTLAANVETLRLQGGVNLVGTGNGDANWLYGNSGNNILWGLGGNDYLDGGTGSDTLRGGQGSDVYVVDDAGDLVIENAGEGTDTVRAYISHTLAANVEYIQLYGTSNINGTGNDLANGMTGNSGNNVLDGGLGNDFINGLQGNDTLMGGSGNDTYRFAKGDGMDLINDYDTTVGNVDKLSFDGTISQNSVAFWMTDGNLELGYTDSAGDQITVQNQGDSDYAIERFELSNGFYLSNSDVNQVIADMTAYATSNGITLASLDDVKNDNNLMAIVNAAWHA